MNVSISRQDPASARVDVLVVALPAGEAIPRALRSLDSALGGQIQAYLDSEAFRPSAGQSAELPGTGIEARSVVLLGLGDEKKLTTEAVRAAFGGVIKRITKRKASSVGLAIPRLRKLPPAALGQALAEAAVLAGYRFDKYRTMGDEIVPIERVQIHALDNSSAAGMRAGARTGTVIGEATCLARDLANEPGSVHTPAWLAQQARALGRDVGLKVRVMAVRELERAGMGGILSVGKGAAYPPRLISLEYGERKARRSTIALVGKGVTFDSGGISIKPAGNMDAMKGDMSGGAAVIGAMRAIAQLKLPLHVIGIVGAAMNMPDGEAYVPGDIVKTAAGKTIEVLNTDAEGRIVLADALHHATTFKPDAIIDLATLTGAKVVAVGSACCAVMGNDEPLIKRIRDAGDRCHERAWPLPLWDEHKKAIRSAIADLKNTGGRNAGSSTAGALLSEFVGEVRWAHLDIAGNERTESGSPYCVKGATGFGVRLLLELLRSWK